MIGVIVTRRIVCSQLVGLRSSNISWGIVKPMFLCCDTHPWKHTHEHQSDGAQFFLGEKPPSNKSGAQDVVVVLWTVLWTGATEPDPSSDLEHGGTGHVVIPRSENMNPHWVGVLTHGTHKQQRRKKICGNFIGATGMHASNSNLGKTTNKYKS